MTLCLCGCGRTTGNEFAPGHDARYKSQLLRRYINDGDEEALKILQARKWTKFIEASRRQAKIKAERAVRKARIQRKVEIAEDPSLPADRIRVLKCAGEVLKASDQYHRRSRNYIAMTDWLDAYKIIAGEHERVLVDPTELWPSLPHMDAVDRFIDDPDVHNLGIYLDPLREFLLARVA